MKRSLSLLELFEEYTRVTGLFGVYLSVSTPDLIRDELSKAVPLLTSLELDRLFLEESLFLFFSEQYPAFEMFQSVIGDDGPTKTNPYDGPARVFAYLSGPNGGISENT